MQRCFTKLDEVATALGTSGETNWQSLKELSDLFIDWLDSFNMMEVLASASVLQRFLE